MQRCMGCMREFADGFDICPHCGYVVGTSVSNKTHLPPGTALHGRYVLGKVLGQGGFGITYIAWDQTIGRPVAVKEYLPNAFASRLTGERDVSCYSEAARRQFDAGLQKTQQEAHALSKFETLESVVKVYDCFGENKTAYIVMELLRGQTVKEILNRCGRLPYAETVKIMWPVLQTLDAMHKVGMIHRDVAPDNIFVCGDGRVKLLDFGAARVVNDADGKSLSVMLKHGYAPVEQYTSRGQQGSFTDVYAACATIYKMLTGETPPESLDRADEDTLRPIHESASISPQAESAILCGMAVRARDRAVSIPELLAALEGAPRPSGRDKSVPRKGIDDVPPTRPLPDGTTPAAAVTQQMPPVKTSRKPLYITMIAAVLVVALIVTGVAIAANRRIEAAQANAAAAVPETASTIAAASETIPESETTVTTTSAPTSAAASTTVPITAGTTAAATAVPAETAAPAVRQSGATIGSVITFGTYEQDNDDSDGKEAIEWIVLDTEGNKALLISKYVLDAKAFESIQSESTWETCTLRTWLNDTFLKMAFSTSEQSRICTTTVTADANPKYSTDPGNSTTDKVFLLSIDEAGRYFASDDSRNALPTAYAIAQDLYLYHKTETVWWLRTPGFRSTKTTQVLAGGCIDYSGVNTDWPQCGLRPAMWITV